MKYVSTFLLVLGIICSNLIAQLPNNGFENWTGGEPDGWSTNNADPYITVTQSNSSHSGSSALKGEAINYLPPFLPVIGPSIICEGENGEGFPIASRFNSLKGYYKFNPQGGDKLFIEVFVSTDTIGIGVGTIFLEASASYTEFAVPINYIDPAIPTLCFIFIQVMNPVGGVIVTLGSEMYLDDLQLSMDVVSGIEVQNSYPNTFSLEQNYPNPFNPTTTISYSIPTPEYVTLKVFDVLGNEVSTLVDEELPAGSHKQEFNSKGLSSGIYFYKITAGAFAETKKMTMLK